MHKQKYEEVQALDRAHREYYDMKMRMQADIKDLLLKMEATRQSWFVISRSVGLSIELSSSQVIVPLLLKVLCCIITSCVLSVIVHDQ